jgi:hypothetical protein
MLLMATYVLVHGGGHGGWLPRTNINCTQSLRTSEPDALARQLDGDRNWEIDTGHDLMITEPDVVAEMLLRLVEQGS